MSTTKVSTAIHGARSPRWLGNPRHYQSEAQRRYALDRDRVVLPWSYVTTDCEVPMCLDTECMTLHAPKHLEYPAGVCIYCGMPSAQRDHLLPKPMTGEALRKFVLIVPACAECNNAINDFPSCHVGERRRVAQAAIKRKNKNLLTRPHKSARDLRELGHGLRTVAIKNNNRALAVKARLAWPVDPFYDLRAFQKAGIDDPAALELCDDIALSLLDREGTR